jgi:heptose-I-phosphate ethanolaminephosphotransferase
MNRTRKLTGIFAAAVKPWTQNFTFFFMMYLLGCVTAWLTVPHYRNAHIYEHLYSELFFDISFLCIILWMSGKYLRPVLRAVFYTVAYTLALVDVYCFVTYDTTITPTVMMLMAETDMREAGEFMKSLISPSLIFGKVGWILLILLAHLSLRFLKIPFRNVRLAEPVKREILHPLFGVIFSVAFIITGVVSYPNKVGLIKLMTAGNIGSVEHLLTEKQHGVTYQPIYRLAFSLYANSLTSQQIMILRNSTDKAEVDSCSFTSPKIVLIIGESLSKNHSQQYGYWQPTTPRQSWFEGTGDMVKFTDVVCPWNLTSFVFKLMISTYTVGDKGEWCDYPLFTALFRKAGYHVTFLTNQFLPKAKEPVYDFSGGFFLNDPELSTLQFDTRNDRLHQFDESLVDDYKRLKPSDDIKGELAIFHLIGQHVQYSQRSPKDRKVFKKEDYAEAKPHLKAHERKILADYDNAVLYNDSVVTAIIKQFIDKDAVVIYVPDHGEECYEGDLHFFCRMHSTEITSRLAHAEFDIPFWIYCTKTYQKNRPEIFAQIKAARNRRYMTDALPHLLLYLAGIHTKDYNERYNLISPNYDENRPRILKNTTDYDKLK